jgi:enterochelin esterase-like enzyme
VRPRAERLWGASTRREQRLLVGKSSGAGWALDTALRHPDLFGQAAPIALGWTRASGLDRPGRPRLFMVTGVLDSFITRSRAAAEEAAKSGDPLVFQTPVTGHGDAFYQGDWVEILTWAFPAR